MRRRTGVLCVIIAAWACGGGSVPHTKQATGATAGQERPAAAAAAPAAETAGAPASAVPEAPAAAQDETVDVVARASQATPAARPRASTVPEPASAAPPAAVRAGPGTGKPAAKGRKTWIGLSDGGALREGPPVEQVQGGDIPRSALLAVLSHGIGRFLQKVRAEPHLVGGRFVGWRLLSLFENEPSFRVAGLAPGDTVMRVNGQSIERPEQFKTVWDSLATQSELVLLVQRAGQPAEVRYRIVDGR